MFKVESEFVLDYDKDIRKEYFETYEEAKKYYLKEIEFVEKENFNYSEVTKEEDYYEAYDDGFYDENHIVIFIKKVSTRKKK